MNERVTPDGRTSWFAAGCGAARIPTCPSKNAKRSGADSRPRSATVKAAQASGKLEELALRARPWIKPRSRSVSAVRVVDRRRARSESAQGERLALCGVVGHHPLRSTAPSTETSHGKRKTHRRRRRHRRAKAAGSCARSWRIPSSGFRARAITRKANGEKAEALRKLGAEVVEADLDNEASLAKAFEGAYGAYCVTNYWEHFTPAKELSQARNMAQAAKAAKLNTSSGPRSKTRASGCRCRTRACRRFMEKYKVPHFDAKGEADACSRERACRRRTCSRRFYWDNFIYFGMGPKKGPDGKFAITMPMGNARLSGIAAEDIGKCAYGIFKRASEWIGKTRRHRGRSRHGRADGGATCLRALGQEVAYNAVHPEAFAASVSRAPTTRQHVPVLPDSKGIRGRARPGTSRSLNPGAARLQVLAREVQGPHPARMTLAMTNPQNPWHARVYYDIESWDTAQLVHQQFSDMVVTGTCAGLVLVGQMYDRGVGPHLQPQLEIHFYESAVPRITEILQATGLTSLIHPLTDDDLADHTTLAQWIGSPLPLDVSALDPPGHNEGIAQFGKEEFSTM